jgi:hypothetical protein
VTALPLVVLVITIPGQQVQWSGVRDSAAIQLLDRPVQSQESGSSTCET